MKPGRDLDALIAEKVFHAKAKHFIPYYSRDINAAWLIVEKLAPKIFVGPLPWISNGREYPNEYVASYDANDSYADCWDWVSGESAPHAICMAALEIVKEKEIVSTK